MVKDGKIHSFVLDSIDASTAWMYHNDLQRFFPDGKHYQFTSYEDENEFTHQIQYGPNGCQIFTEDHLEVLSNIDGDQLYSALEKKSHQETREVLKFKHMVVGEKVEITSNVLTLKDFDEDLSFMGKLLRTIQSKAAFSRLSESIKSSPVSSKLDDTRKHSLTLEEYEARHTGEISVKNKVKQTNLAINRKSERKENKSSLLLEDITDKQFDEIQKNRQGFAFLENPALFNTKNPISFIKIKNSSNYLDRNHEFFALREKKDDLLSLGKKLNEKYPNKNLENKIEAFNRKFMQYNDLLNKLNDPLKYGIKEKNDLISIEREFKKIKKEVINDYVSLNKLSQSHFVRYAKSLDNNLLRAKDILDTNHFVTNIFSQAFNKVYLSIKKLGGNTSKLDGIFLDASQALKSAHSNKKNVNGILKSARSDIKKSKGKKNPSLEDIDNIEMVYTNAIQKMSQQNQLYIVSAGKITDGLNESKDELYKIIKLIDVELHKRTLFYFDKSEKKEALNELKNRLVNAYNKNENIQFKDVIKDWKIEYSDVISKQRSLISRFKKESQERAKTGTEEFIEGLESKFQI